MSTNMKCTIINLHYKELVLFYTKYITNALYLALLKKQFKITYDSLTGGACIVHRPVDKNKFHCYSNGLHWVEYNVSQFTVIERVSKLG